MSEVNGIEADLDRFAWMVGNWIFRSYVLLCRAVDNCIYGRSTRYESVTWSSYDNEGRSQFGEYYHELDIDSSNYVMLHQVVRSLGSHIEYKYAVHFSNEWRRPYTLRDLFHSPPPPWLLIGYGSPDNLNDCTDFFNCLIAYDNKITPKLLSFMKELPEDTKWYYMNPKTFELAEFPSDGIVIEDVVPEPEPEEEIKHELEPEKVD